MESFREEILAVLEKAIVLSNLTVYLNKHCDRLEVILSGKNYNYYQNPIFRLYSCLQPLLHLFFSQITTTQRRSN